MLHRFVQDQTETSKSLYGQGWWGIRHFRDKTLQTVVTIR